MKLDTFLRKKLLPYFILFLVLALVAFWPGYFGRILGTVDGHFHRHGLSMTLWLLMLITQAYLIRSGKRQAHHLTGKSSYVIAPLVAICAFDLIHFTFSGIQAFGPEALYALALMINAVVAFLLLYGLAIYFRKEPTVHARYMVCTVFPLFTPVTDRLIYQFYRPLVAYAPTIGQAPVVPFYGFVLADTILLGLCLWDGLSNKRWNVFPVALLILVTYHLTVFSFYKFPFWESFGWWFVRLSIF